jgi:hypothetical protein
MDKDSDKQRDAQSGKGDEDWPPPFNPDLRLVTFLEGGRKSKAEEWVRKALREREPRR